MWIVVEPVLCVKANNSLAAPNIWLNVNVSPVLAFTIVPSPAEAPFIPSVTPWAAVPLKVNVDKPPWWSFIVESAPWTKFPLMFTNTLEAIVSSSPSATIENTPATVALPSKFTVKLSAWVSSCDSTLRVWFVSKAPSYVIVIVELSLSKVLISVRPSVVCEAIVTAKSTFAASEVIITSPASFLSLVSVSVTAPRSEALLIVMTNPSTSTVSLAVPAFKIPASPSPQESAAVSVKAPAFAASFIGTRAEPKTIVAAVKWFLKLKILLNVFEKPVASTGLIVVFDGIFSFLCC